MTPLLSSPSSPEASFSLGSFPNPKPKLSAIQVSPSPKTEGSPSKSLSPHKPTHSPLGATRSLKPINSPPKLTRSFVITSSPSPTANPLFIFPAIRIETEPVQTQQDFERTAHAFWKAYPSSSSKAHQEKSEKVPLLAKPPIPMPKLLPSQPSMTDKTTPPKKKLLTSLTHHTSRHLTYDTSRQLAYDFSKRDPCSSSLNPPPERTWW